MATKNIAIGTIRVGLPEGDEKVFEHGDKVTGLKKERMQELEDAGVLVTQRKFDFLFPPDEDEEEEEARLAAEESPEEAEPPSRQQSSGSKKE